MPRSAAARRRLNCNGQDRACLIVDVIAPLWEARDGTTTQGHWVWSSMSTSPLNAIIRLSLMSLEHLSRPQYYKFSNLSIKLTSPVTQRVKVLQEWFNYDFQMTGT
ncbi:hypothetical protein chiPu_0014574 [Chiloscyllium punctatum]|uniref:Uncharacterized protein n=1 Tax=Chiloscyllium punctatum TaxID=137246 RepID=A0A401T0A7_CHIPU|nr:hypothetical protein [Chiloscyllium punctatum]